jgi:hypothetical protein
MAKFSERMEQAIKAVRLLPVGQQDCLAEDVMQWIADASSDISDAECAELSRELAAARRGEFATDAEVAVVLAKHGL